MASFAEKLKKAGALISKGKFKQLFNRIRAKALKKRSREQKYHYLRKKYSSFIADKVKNNLRTGEGDKITETPNIMWWLWLQGEDNAPDVCKACLRSLKRWHSDKKIITLNSDNLHEYITLPDYINGKYKRGIISHTHYSDLVRLQLLIEYGGTWIDSTVFCTGRKFEYIMHLPLFLFSCDKEDTSTQTWIASSWFIVSAPHDPILTLTRDLLFQYWKDYSYTIHYFIFHMFQKPASEMYSDIWNQIPFFPYEPPNEMIMSMYQDYTEEKMNHFREISDFHVLTYKLDPEKMPSEKSIYHHVVYDE